MRSTRPISTTSVTKSATRETEPQRRLRPRPTLTMEHHHRAGAPQLLAQATAPRSPIKVFLGAKLPGRVMTPAAMVLVMVSPCRGTVPQDLVEQTGPQLLTERTLAMELPGRPTVPVKGIMVTQPPCGGTVPQLLVKVAASQALAGVVVLTLPPSRAAALSELILGVKLVRREAVPQPTLKLTLALLLPCGGKAPQRLFQLTAPQGLILTRVPERPRRERQRGRGCREPAEAPATTSWRRRWARHRPPCRLRARPRLLLPRAGVSAGSGGRPPPPPRARPRGPGPPPRVGPTCLSRGRPAGWPPMRRP